MGNIGSQIGHINQRQTAEEQQWAHSFPRTQQQRPSQHKVLPEREVGIKLRSTNNGEILHSGGTLTGRQHQNRHPLEKENAVGPAISPRSPQSKTYLSNQRDPLHKAGHRYPQALDIRQPNGINHMGFRDQMKKFGSEPDLRYSAQEQENLELREKSRLKKKYRAPPPPKVTSATPERHDWEDNLNGETSSPIRRARLFKTRAETKKNYSSPVYNHKPLDFKEKHDPLSPKACASHHEVTNRNHEPVQLRQRNDIRDIRANRLSLPEVKLSQNTMDFQEELKEATKRLRHSKILQSSRESTNNERNQKDSKEKLRTLDHNIKQKENLRQKLKQLAREHQNFTIPIDCVRGEGSGKESSSPDQSPPDRNSKNFSKDKNPKTFYFGMDNQVEDEFNNEIDNFTSALQVTTRLKRCSSESDLSSELEMDESQTSRNGIDIHLRPILPKKQLEIPRFSPAAAWRLLSAMDANQEVSTITSDDVQAFIEERIEKFARPPPPTVQGGQRSTNDKSGDSGISGDAGEAGPPGFEDGPDVTGTRNNLQRSSPLGRTQGLSWTPQQDLGDDSSLEEGTNHNHTDEAYRQKFANKPHVFSLSLPRDNHLASYLVDRQMHISTSLQKIKRSVSGVLTNLGNNTKKTIQPNTQDQTDNNWFLSKSAPNSLNNGFNSLDVKHSHKSDDIENSLVPNSKHSSGRLMYLPEFSDFVENKIRSRMQDEEDKGRSASEERPKHKLSLYSKSCENISIDLRSSSEPEDLQDPPPRIIPGEEQWRVRKPKRFTFQSTVRQIERKRLAEKLSREAERKEMQRLRELEAMQKVEEEFQRKRAREKANIRHQLRLFTMDDASWSSLPPDIDSKDVPVPRRPEPDGAVSSSATSSPSLPLQKSPEITKKFQKNKKLLEMKHKHRANSESSEENKVKAPVTQVLSEYRQPQREYKEYRGTTRYLNDLSDSHNKQTTVHPQVTCNMPKATPQSSAKHGKNYRKDFIHGVKSTRSGGSTYSEESQSRENSPRMYHNKHAPITRF